MRKEDTPMQYRQQRHPPTAQEKRHHALYTATTETSFIHFSILILSFSER
jgi:hypothetical protein